jgi:hypothetical protein
MSPEEIKATIDAVIANKVILTYTQLSLFVLFCGIAAYFGAYIRKKGENLATIEDIRLLTEKVESIRTVYSKQVEDYKTELSMRAQAAMVASLFAEWISITPDLKELNRLAWEATLWLPDDIALEVNKRLQNRADAKDIKIILVDIKGLIHGQKSKMNPMDITHY